MLTELWVDRTDYRRTRVVRGDYPEPGAGEILVAIDKFAMTANNVTYAGQSEDRGRRLPTLSLSQRESAR